METHDAVLMIKGRLELGDKRMDDLEKKQEQHEHTLYGNAKPGLVEVVGDMGKTAGAKSRLGWLTVGAALAAVGGIISRHL